MAWIFSLSAECGSKKEDAERFCKHFKKVTLKLSTGIESKCEAETFQDEEDNWWGMITNAGLSNTGINTAEDAYQMTEIGILLYQKLQSVTSFRYGLVGVEVDYFRTYSELIENPHILNIYFPGLVLSFELWEMIGRPVCFQFFSIGYVWKPYQGEVYKPLD
ncbi:MAG TPA: hypothetical protein V6D13_05490 [Halomicronema sp.]